MLWEKLTAGQKYLYSCGLCDFYDNTPLILSANEPVTLNETMSLYWLGYRDAEQVENEGSSKILITNEQVFNHCN